MRFEDEKFRQLVKETEESIIRLGTTSHAVLNLHKRFAKMLGEHLNSEGIPFELVHCLQWVNSLKHEPASAASTSYVQWIAFHRYIHLLAEQQAGTLVHWHHYQSCSPKLPETEEFQRLLEAFRERMEQEGKTPPTAKSYASYVRRLLLFFEQNGICTFSAVTNYDILTYLKSERFAGRNVKGIQTELCCLKKFLCFAEETGYTESRTLHCALPKLRHSSEKIITIVDKQIEDDLLEDEPDSLVNKRDRAVLLLALHTGLRSCDIRALKFRDIDWDKQTIHIRQQKTGVDLEIPIDSATQNAIIDYILNERRKCSQEYIFITSVGPAQKLARRHYRMKYRARETDSYELLPHDGLHIYRRTFASRLLQTGTPLPVISEMLGHVDKNTVRMYLATDEQKMKRCALGLLGIPCRREEY